MSITPAVEMSRDPSACCSAPASAHTMGHLAPPDGGLNPTGTAAVISILVDVPDGVPVLLDHSNVTVRPLLVKIITAPVNAPPALNVPALDIVVETFNSIACQFDPSEIIFILSNCFAIGNEAYPAIVSLPSPSTVQTPVAESTFIISSTLPVLAEAVGKVTVLSVVLVVIKMTDTPSVSVTV